MREQLRGHLNGVNVMALSTDESILVTGSEDCTARIWAITGDPDPDEEEGRLLGELESVPNYFISCGTHRARTTCKSKSLYCKNC